MDVARFENSLQRQSQTFLLLAVVFGIAAGAVVAMYYEVVLDMGRFEDSIESVLAILYLLSVATGLARLARVATDARQRGWKQTLTQAALALGPVLVFLGSEGLLSHYLWWSPISDTDRFHILHHTLVAGAPLTLLYWLAVRCWWAPGGADAVPTSKGALVLTGGIVLVFIVVVGILFGSFGTAILVAAGMLASAGLAAGFAKRQPG